MKLHSPFEIGPRLAPALRIQGNGRAWLTYVNGRFIIDLPDGSSHKVVDFHPPRMRVQGANPLVDDFKVMLSFLGACAESRSYAERKGKDAMDGENSDLFPPNVGEWAQGVSDELAMLQCELEESETELIED